MSDHPNDVEMEEIEDSAMAVEHSEPTVYNVGKTNLTDAAKAGICSDDETGSTVTIGEVGIDEYFDEKFCDDSVVDTTDYREAEATAAANLLPVLINMIGNGDSASGEASGEESGEASVEASGEASGEASEEESGEASAEASGEASGEAFGEASGEAFGEASGGAFGIESGEASSDYQDKLTDIVRSAHTSIENADDEQPTASTSTAGRRPLIPREAAIAASQALVSVTPKRRRPGDNDRPERTFLLRGYIDANQSIRKSCQDYGLNLPEAAYDAINLDEHLIRNCYLSILPARTSVHDILDKYVKERNANVDMFNFLLVAFDEVLPIWCLRRVEQLQHEKISKKFPGRRMSTIYGLIHFLRYTMYLPRLFSRLEFTRVVERDAKIHPVVEFLNGFFVYMVDHGLHIDVNLDYDIMVLSEYQKAYEVLHKTYPAEPSIVID